MNESGAPYLLAAAPQLKTADIFRAAAYYRDVLGFSYDELIGEPPSFCLLRRDGAALMLSSVRPGEAALRPTAGTAMDMAAYIWLRGVDAYHAEIAAKGATILREPFLAPYGIRELVVADLDGNKLVFGEILPASPEAHNQP